MSPLHEQLRHARPGSLRPYPVALRRGWVACVLETVAEHRRTFIGVMGRQWPEEDDPALLKP